MRNLLAIAVILALATTIWTWWPRETKIETPVSAEGALLTETQETVPPEKVASLRVVTWDSSENSPRVFEVARKGGDWVIPSHFDYPADSGTRVGDTAGAVLNVPRGPLVTSDIKKHAELGVVDPLEEATEVPEGRGKRVTLKDEGGATLVDLIIGKKVENANVYYVREAGDESVYTANVNPDIRTAFKDWVKTDLLDIKRNDIRAVTILDRSVDEARGQVINRSTTSFTKEPGEDTWESPHTPVGRVVDQEALKDMVRELTGLKLVGVRPFSNLWLQSRGFYVMKDGTLVGNEGSIQVNTKNGIVYHLFFGEIALGDEEDTSAEAANKTTDEQTAGEHNRYMAVFVHYSPELDEDLPAPVTPKELAEAKQEVSEQDQESGDDGQSELEKQAQERQEEIAEGTEEAEKLQKRFGRFFYVISNDSFEKLRPARKDLFKIPEPEGTES